MAANQAIFAEAAKTELDDAVVSANTVQNEGYSETAWREFQNALSEAQNVSSEASYTQLNALKEKLQNAQLNLELDKAKNALKTVIASAAARYAQGRQDSEEERWKVFSTAYQKALSMDTNTAGVKDIARINALSEELSAAQNNLTSGSEGPGGPGEAGNEQVVQAQQALAAVIDAAAAVKNKGQQNYTDASWTAFITAYNHAEAGRNSTDMAQLSKLRTDLANAQKALKEVKLENGNTVVVNDVLYKVTNAAKKTVTAVSGTNKNGSTSITIQSTVVVNKETCTVTEIDADAFKNYKKLKKVTIGSNVTKVGKAAFSGCKNLKNIKVQSKVLKTFGKKALKGTNAKLTVKIQKKMSSAKLRNKLIKQIKKAGNKKVKVK